MTFNHLNTRYIEVEPHDAVTFTDVAKKSCISVLRITNVYRTNVLFKVKTTAPSTYVVRPNLVILSPGETSQVQIYMKASNALPSSVNFKDRFMIIATDVDEDPTAVDTSAIWGEKPAESLQQVKIRAIFKAPGTPGTLNRSPESQRGSLILHDPRKSTPRINLTNDDSHGSHSSLGSIITTESKKKPSVSYTKPSVSYTKAQTPMELPDYNNERDYSGYNKSMRTANGQYKGQYLQTSHMGNRLLGSPATMKSGNEDEGKDFKKEYERLLSKVEEQEKQLLKVCEERNYVYNELVTLKDNLARKRAPTKSATTGENHTEFRILHVIIVAIVSLLLGAFFSV